MNILTLALIAVIAFLLVLVMVLEIRLSAASRPTYVIAPQPVQSGTLGGDVALAFVVAVLALIAAVVLLL